jgi:predicted enzyme related to lactoylglutathione lyase
MASRKAIKKRAATRNASRRKAAKKKRAAERPAARTIRPGFISHTELSSSNPDATVAWCKAALGWKFGASMPTPNGPYHMWSFGDYQGGGVSAVGPGQKPGSTPFVEFRTIRAGYEKALKAGATSVMPPDEIPGGNGWIAIVSAPGGVAIGLWAPKE